MQKNLCTACGRNFATAGMHNEHRTGTFPYTTRSGKHVASTRRCMTDEELKGMKWELQMLDVDVLIDGVLKKQPMQTWVMPGQLAKRKAHADRTRKRFKKVSL